MTDKPEPSTDNPRWVLLLEIVGTLGFVIFMLGAINDWLPAWALILLGAATGACAVGAVWLHRRV